MGLCLPIFVFFLPTFSFLKEKVRFFFKEKARRVFSMIRFAPIFTALDPRRRSRSILQQLLHLIFSCLVRILLIPLALPLGRIFVPIPHVMRHNSDDS